MGKHKDFFGIAQRGFKNDLKFDRSDRETSLSLKDQLKKYGTTAEKRAIAISETKVEDTTLTQVFEKEIKVNVWS